MTRSSPGILVRLSLWTVIVMLCATFGLLIGGAVGIGTGYLLWFDFGGLLAGLLCGLLGTRYGLPYSGRAVGTVLSGSYLLLYALSIIYGLVAGPSAGPSLLGVSAVILAWPWSSVMVVMAEAVESSVFDSVAATVALLSVCALVNAAVLYALGLLMSLSIRLFPSQNLCSKTNTDD